MKQIAIQVGLSVLSKMLESKPDSKLAQFLFSDSMQKTLGDIYAKYMELLTKHTDA
jgi:hypothetical protein